MFRKSGDGELHKAKLLNRIWDEILQFLLPLSAIFVRVQHREARIR